MVKRWMGVVAVALWCVAGGVAVGEEKEHKDRPELRHAKAVLAK